MPNIRKQLFSRHLIRGIPVDHLPPLFVESADPLCNTRELSRGASVVRSATVKATTKLAGIEHGLPDHLENLALKDMSADLGIAAPFDLRCHSGGLSFRRLIDLAMRNCVLSDKLGAGLAPTQ